MQGLDSFFDETVRDLRGRLRLLGDCGDRRALEDGIALLTGVRLAAMDEGRFETMLTALLAGRAPAGLSVLKPRAVARELSLRWERYRAGVAVPAVN